MSQLIAINPSSINNTAVPTVNARELHVFLGSKQEFRHWIKDRIAKYGFAAGVDYTTAENFIRGGNRVDYHLSLDMAKELAMVERNEKGKQARLYFIECERKAKAAPPALDLNNPASLRAALLDYTEKVQELQATVAEQAPKVEGFERIADGHGALTMRAGTAS